MTPISGGKYVVTPSAKPTKCAQTIEITVKTPYRYGENDIELVEGANAKAQLKQWPGQSAAHGDGKALEPYATDGWVTLRTNAGVCTYKPE